MAGLCSFWSLRLWIIFCFFFLKVSGSQQYFRLRPKDQKIQEGGEVKLECEISNLQGQVQWTKDGFALGFTAEIPGYPRYSYVGDRRNGVYNLLIKNVSLEDDGDFQCQVGPSSAHRAIRANATLTVVSPPASIEIKNLPPGQSKIQTNENQEVEIECLVKKSKPAAQVKWYRGGTEIKSGSISETVIEEKERRITRYNVLSKLKLKPSASDDYAEYVCEARHEALPHDLPLRTKVQLSVLYPPGPPYIEGYVQGETVRRGQTVELACRSRGGNPPAQLIWYKNGEQIRMAYRTAARISENIYSFTADPSDNNAVFRCEATNIMITTPLKTEVTLHVLFAPARVTISGPTEAKAGEKVPLTCTTDSSNPAAEIKWLVGGRQLRNTTSLNYTAPDGGFITTSNITVNVGQNKRSAVVICHGLNMQLTENVVSTHTINILHPPNHPIISGYTEGTSIAAGTVQRMSCISSEGNPLATLTWYKNDKKITSVSKIVDRSVSAEITILANVTDNGAVYKCEASNSATEVPLFEAVKLDVLFPPDHVVIKKTPEQLKPGQTATLTCESSSSHPAAKLSWWKLGIPVEAEIKNSSKPGLHGGVVSHIEMKVDVTPDIGGTVFTCQATNEALQRSVHDAFTLDVLYKPIFASVPEEAQVGIEGESLVVSLNARGNPTNLAYTWSKEGLPLTKKSLRILADGPTLNFTRLSRNDTGVYSCEASNSEGQTTINLNVTVKYPLEIVEAPTAITVDNEQDATMYCKVDGFPVEESHVTWRSKAVSDLKARSSRSFKNTTAFLLMHGVTREDAGVYECVADNGVANKSVKAVQLLVKYKPEIDMSPTRIKSASNTGGTARLTCRTSSVPRPRFMWSRKGATLLTNTSSKYSVEYHDIDLSTFETVLVVKDVENEDYGKYECEAKNEKGLATGSITLDVTSPPDTPLTLTVLNVTHDAVTLAWTPGFDGGLSPSYRIRYKPVESNLLVAEGYRYLDVVTENITTFIVTGLDLDTEYFFSIMAFNKLGSSSYFANDVKARTSSIHLPEELLGKADVPRIVIIAVSITGAILLIFNILLVIFFIARKRQGKETKKAGPSEQGSNKSATIEMYAPSSYNETVTGETLSSVSEKSENYSNGENNEEYPDDGRKAASTYLIDQIDYPFQYSAAYEMQQQMQGNHMLPETEHLPGRNTLPLPVLKNANYVANSMLPPQTIDGAYYNLQPDSRYMAYPPPLDYSHTLPGHGSLRRARGPVPPDVTVLHNPPVLSATLVPQPPLSTFGPSPVYPPSLETEGHLV